MDTHDIALASAGVVGSGVALVHGALTQRLMVEPFQQLAEGNLSPTIRRIVPLLLQFSTYNWFIGGIALIIAAFFFQRQAKVAIGLLVGSSYVFGALGNLWATRGFHPGWLLYVVASGLIAYGLYASDHG
jgi:hypothetical protein